VLVERANIPFESLPVVKFPRYASWKWLTFPFDWARARTEARRYIRRERPDAVVTAGGFTAVPIVFAASALGIPCFTHQLDLQPGLSNRQIAKRCVSVTTSFEYADPPFGRDVDDMTIATPTRFSVKHVPSVAVARKHFGLDAAAPVVLVFGGGTGAQALNEAVSAERAAWKGIAQVLHVTGLGKAESLKSSAGYIVRPFLGEDMLTAYAAADVVVARPGMGTLTEIAALKKPAIVVPMPGSHQEWNARAMEERGAVLVMDQQSRTFADDLRENVRLLLANKELRTDLGEAAHAALPTDDGTALARRIITALNVPAC
jgi:UDP-N-acetylglucosamine--N-acetylmuramyl-(pentapeptide) pyrophosphoryl-undecaprenol N-acetylglucosamine transferase